MVLWAQPNRDYERHNSKEPCPKLSDLRGAGRLEENADVLLGIYRKGCYTRYIEDENSTDIIIIKCK